MSTDKNLCTYCERDLDGSLEHVIPSAIGGLLECRRILCSRCNVAFGSSIDKALAEALAPISNALDITTGRGESPPTLRGVKMGSGEIVDLTPGAQPSAHRTVIQEEHRDGKVFIRVSGRPSAADSVLKVFEQLVRKHRPEGGGDLVVNASLKQRFIDEPATLTLTVDSPELRRAAAKIGLNLLVEQTDSGVGRGHEFEELRSYIKGDSADEDRVRLDTGLRQPMVEGIDGSSMSAHRVVVSANGKDGLVVAIVDLFRLVRFSVVMSEDYKGETFVIVHSVDPIAGTKVTEKSTTAEPLRRSELADRGATDAAIRDRVAALSSRIRERIHESLVSRIASEAVESVLGDGSGEAPSVLTQEHVDKIARSAAQKFMDHRDRIDRSSPVDLDRLRSQVRAGRHKRRRRR